MNGNNKGAIHIAFNEFTPPPLPSPPPSPEDARGCRCAELGGGRGVGWFLNFNFSCLVSDATTNGGNKLRGHNVGEERAGARTQTPVCMAAAVLFD